ncbi:MAG: GNAT family N-acetyltransferase, partial [Gemmatimonadales bacterium]
MPPHPVLTVNRTDRTPTPPDEGEGAQASVLVRKACLADVPELLRISHAIYGDRGSWKAPELRLHQEVFPDGQFVAEEVETGRVLGMAVSLVVSADEWPLEVPWRVITDNGRLTTHTDAGDTLYAAGVAVDPAARGMGVGSAIYRGREALALELGLRRIRAGARIPGYGPLADRMSPEAYVEEV